MSPYDGHEQIQDDGPRRRSISQINNGIPQNLGQYSQPATSHPFPMTSQAYYQYPPAQYPLPNFYHGATRHMPTSSAFSAYTHADEDWTLEPDLGKRRRIQNRIAQRKYRGKLKSTASQLESRWRQTGDPAHYEDWQSALSKITGNSKPTSRLESGATSRGKGSPDSSKRTTPQPESPQPSYKSEPGVHSPDYHQQQSVEFSSPGAPPGMAHGHGPAMYGGPPSYGTQSFNTSMPHRESVSSATTFLPPMEYAARSNYENGPEPSYKHTYDGAMYPSSNTLNQYHLGTNQSAHTSARHAPIPQSIPQLDNSPGSSPKVKYPITPPEQFVSLPHERTVTYDTRIPAGQPGFNAHWSG